jgi:hypothetical protein
VSVVVLNITLPIKGDTIALRCVVVIRGGTKALVVESTCKAPVGFVVPIPTLPFSDGALPVQVLIQYIIFQIFN